MFDPTHLVVAAGAVVAGFVQGVSGFAFGLVAMSFWAWVIDPKLAAVLAVLGALSGQIVAALSVRPRIDRRRLAPFVLGGLAGIPVGVALLPRLDPDWFNLTMLAATLAGYAASGIVTAPTLSLFAVVLPAMLIPAFLGTRVYVGLSDAGFRWLVLMLLTLSGMALLAAALPRLL